MPDQPTESGSHGTLPPYQPTPSNPQPDSTWFNDKTEKITSWIFQTLIGIIAFFAVYQFNEIQNDLKGLRKELMDLRISFAESKAKDLREDLDKMDREQREIDRRLWRMEESFRLTNTPFRNKPTRVPD